MSSKPTLKLDWCSHAAAKYACSKWHYSKTIPTPPMVHVGVWEEGVFIGCLLFGRGANNNLAKPYGLKQTEACELVRVALTAHVAPVSKIVAIAVRLLAKAQKIRLCVSYADPSQGHVGGIYQAGNWIYAGMTPPDCFYIAKDGKRIHSRMVSARGYKMVYGQRRKVPTPSECIKKVVTPGKHRYLMPLDSAMRVKIEPFRKPYPKRAGSIVADATANHAVEGGSLPTPALLQATIPQEAEA